MNDYLRKKEIGNSTFGYLVVKHAKLRQATERERPETPIHI